MLRASTAPRTRRSEWSRASRTSPPLPWCSPAPRRRRRSRDPGSRARSGRSPGARAAVDDHRHDVPSARPRATSATAWLRDTARRRLRTPRDLRRRRRRRPAGPGSRPARAPYIAPSGSKLTAVPDGASSVRVYRNCVCRRRSRDRARQRRRRGSRAGSRLPPHRAHALVRVRAAEQHHADGDEREHAVELVELGQVVQRTSSRRRARAARARRSEARGCRAPARRRSRPARRRPRTCSTRPVRSATAPTRHPG